jgi:hypothetical protein
MPADLEKERKDMSMAKPRGNAGEREGPPTAQISPNTEAGQVPAWELLETGRYMPRRIRGSFLGRELG